jgi:hypothetical protein
LYARQYDKVLSSDSAAHGGAGKLLTLAAIRKSLGHGARRARSHCHFVPPLIHFIPDSLTYSAPLFLKRQCDRTLGARQLTVLKFDIEGSEWPILKQIAAASKAGEFDVGQILVRPPPTLLLLLPPPLLLLLLLPLAPLALLPPCA